MAIKIIILCGLFAIALGFTIPENSLNNDVAFGEELPYGDTEVLVREPRSPERGRVEVRGERQGQVGKTATVTYTHPISKNVDAYVQARRNFKYNDNSGHVGMSYKF